MKIFDNFFSMQLKIIKKSAIFVVLDRGLVELQCSI